MARGTRSRTVCVAAMSVTACISVAPQLFACHPSPGRLAKPRAPSTAAPNLAEVRATAVGTSSLASSRGAWLCLAVAAVVGQRLAAQRSSRGVAARRVVALRAGHALILQNKGGGHGEIGFHLAKALQAKGMKVTMLQDSAAKKAAVPYSLYESALPDTSVVWCDPTDADALLKDARAAVQDGPPITHIFDNYSKSPEQLGPLISVAAESPDFKLYTFISSAGMYTAKGELKEDMPVKDPPTGQRQVEISLSLRLPGKWTSFRPQYIYGPHTNKRSYLDWFLARAAHGLPLPVPGDASQPVNVMHCEDVASLLSSVVGAEEAAAGEAFNCGTSGLVSYKELCEAAGAAVGRPVQVVSLPAGTKTSFPFRPNAEGFFVNVDKAKAKLGWAGPKHNVLEDMSQAGFYTKDFKELGLDQKAPDTSKDVPQAA